MTFDQAEYDIRCEWGLQGVQRLAPISDAIIIVDVLSFTTCVDIATARGVTVWAFPWRDRTDTSFAQEKGAQLARPRASSGLSLSPASMLGLQPGSGLVLPSPNGSTLSLATDKTPTFAGCLRNVSSVARAALAIGPRVAVIPSGELWPDGSLRPCLEDWLGAGAILAHVDGNCSAEARAAVAAYQPVAGDLLSVLLACGSGKELVQEGFARDVELASELMVSRSVPRLVNGAYISVSV
ncbi:MAG: 2-phosphosulfolactate phosphatase [Candidatus Eisenbacteria sp.]|nr:2-phosphosulfolactate phosphatase [Candidatus Eisenbacteria bacterium]